MFNRMYRYAIMFICLLSTLLMPSYAYAAHDEVAPLDTWTYVGNYYLVDNDQKDEAACLALIGESYNTFDSGLKSRLFNSTSDGGVGTDTNPNFPDYAYYRNQLAGYYFPGGNYRWYSRLEGFAYSWAFSKAQKDLQAAIRWWDAYGETVDQPTDGPIEGTNYYSYTLTLSPGVNNSGIKIAGTQYYTGGTNINAPNTIELRISQSLYETIQSMSGYRLMIGGVHGASNNPSSFYPRLLLIPAGTYSIDTQVNNNKTYYGVYSTGYKYYAWSNKSIQIDANTNAYYLNCTTSSNLNEISYNEETFYTLAGPDGAYYYLSGVSGGGTGGPIPDPDPVNPPDPDPVTPVPDPEPVDPGDNWTTIVNNVYNVTQTHVDLQPVIDAISIVNQSIQQGNRNLNTINTNLLNGFQALLGQIDAWASWWSDTWSYYVLWLQSWFSNFGDIFEGMRLEMAEYANDVIIWLNMIYNEINNLNNAPVIEPTIESGNTLQTQTQVNLDALKRKFPTSIPWDLEIIIRLLEAPPLAPDFYLPVVYSNYTVEIDFSPFEPMAAVSRRMSVLLFAVGLLMNTKKLVTIEVASGG